MNREPRLKSIEISAVVQHPIDVRMCLGEAVEFRLHAARVVEIEKAAPLDEEIAIGDYRYLEVSCLHREPTM